jgi:outer membrane lipoprotein SlyB
VTPQPEEKKGWSNAAKGAVIGGAGGAVTGAIISKKKGKGAIIGGVVGAAGGYILGRKKDKKASRDTTY